MALQETDDSPEVAESSVTFVFNWPSELDRLVP